ncbi:conserved domain protein [Ahrensia sp. R2A130]|nr:conserved domain protein [Ahrensia sp. R2A130]
MNLRAGQGWAHSGNEHWTATHHGKRNLSTLKVAGYQGAIACLFSLKILRA